MLLYPQQPLKTRLIRSRELYMTATVLESTWTRGGSAEMLYTHMHGRWYWFPLDVLLTLASNKNPAKTQCEPRAPYHAMTRCVRAGQMRLRRGLPTSLLSTHRCTVSIPYNIHRYVHAHYARCQSPHHHCCKHSATLSPRYRARQEQQLAWHLYCTCSCAF